MVGKPLLFHIRKCLVYLILNTNQKSKILLRLYFLEIKNMSEVLKCIWKNL